MLVFCAPVLQSARMLRHGLAAVALLVPTFHQSVFPKQEAVSSKGGFPGCGSVDDSVKSDHCLQLSFQGEVSSGKTFEQAVGGNLLFRLESISAGWTIEIVPQDTESPERHEYVWVVTPPYRSWNPRDLDTTYGVTAKDSVKTTPREFHFVLNEEQFKRAADLVELAKTSHPQSDHRSPEELQKESDEAIAALMEFPVAEGRLWILDSRITKAVSKDDLGSIEWVRFKVILRVPCDFAASKSTGQFSVDASGCGRPSGKKNK
jgi:hypothetical protein